MNCKYCGKKHDSSSLWCSSECQIKAIYADLSERQVRLGTEFEKVWSENVEELYEN